MDSIREDVPISRKRHGIFDNRKVMINFTRHPSKRPREAEYNCKFNEERILRFIESDEEHDGKEKDMAIAHKM